LVGNKTVGCKHSVDMILENAVFQATVLEAPL